MSSTNSKTYKHYIMTFADLNFKYIPHLQARVAKVESDNKLIQVHINVPGKELYTVTVYDKYNPTLYIQPATAQYEDCDINQVNHHLKAL